MKNGGTIMIHENEICVSQRSFDWWYRRLGRITASDVGVLFAEPRAKVDKDKLTKAQQSYVISKASERVQLQELSLTELQRIYGDQIDLADKNADVARGVKLEPEAMLRFADALLDHFPQVGKTLYVDKCGLFVHKAMSFFGASPDGIVYDSDTKKIESVVEIKCPRVAGHYEVISTKEVKTAYYYQMLAQSFIVGTKTCEFVSYCEEVPFDHQLVVLTHKFDNSEREALIEKVERFNTLIEIEKEKLMKTDDWVQFNE